MEHSERLTDTELVERFVEATARLGPREVKSVTGVSHETIRSYRKGSWKKIQATTRRKMEDHLASLEAKTSAGLESPTKAQLKLKAIHAILGDEEVPVVPEGEPEVSEALLRERFIGAAFQYSDARISELSGLAIESIRQYRDGKWPTRAVNRRSRSKISRFLLHHQRRVGMVRIEDGLMPPQIEAVERLISRLEVDEEFQSRYPNQGAIYLADTLVASRRAMGVLTYEDEVAWNALKRGRRYDADTADRISVEEWLGGSVGPFGAEGEWDRDEA